MAKVKIVVVVDIYSMKPGDFIEVVTKEGGTFSGLVMPYNDSSIVSLKLSSGYNIGISKNKIKSFKKLNKKIEDTKVNSAELKLDPKLKTITILHTGGTFASKVSYKTGAVSPSFAPEDIVRMIPELNGIVNLKSRLIGNMFSEDMRFSHYNIIAKEIEKELKSGVDGIVVTHGTDTLALSSCALAFALENLNKPVILVGSQRSSDRPSSDAAMNLLCAINFILKSNFSDVAICMHSRSGDEFCDILPACKTKKIHTSRRDAFKAVNSSPIARISKDGEVKLLIEYSKKEHKDKLKLKLFDEKLKVGILKAHPNMFSFEIKNYAKYEGVILEGMGIAGNFPINIVDAKTKEHRLILSEIAKLCKKIPVVVSSNCIFGRINMNVYDTGRNMQKAGVVGNFSDMLTETAFIKLAWLLSNFKKNEVRDLFMKNFRGELSSRTKFDEEFV